MLPPSLKLRRTSDIRCWMLVRESRNELLMIDISELDEGALEDILSEPTERSQIRLYQKDDSGWRFPQAVAEKLGWPDNTASRELNPPRRIKCLK